MQPRTNSKSITSGAQVRVYKCLFLQVFGFSHIISLDKADKWSPSQHCSMLSGYGKGTIEILLSDVGARRGIAINTQRFRLLTKLT